MKATIGIDDKSKLWIGDKYKIKKYTNLNGWIHKDTKNILKWNLFFDDGDGEYKSRLSKRNYDLTLLEFEENYNSQNNIIVKKFKGQISKYKPHTWCFVEPEEVMKILKEL